MSPRAALALLAVVIALFVVALAVGLGRGGGASMALPAWTAALGTWLAGEQELPASDLRPARSGSGADVRCHDDLTQRGTLTLPANGTCGLFVSASSKPVRTLALRLSSGTLAGVRVEGTDRDDRPMPATPRSLRGDGVLRLQFYEEGGGLVVSCPTACTLVVATPGPT